MHSSISNNKSKARGLVSRRHLRHLSTISEWGSGEPSRGNRARIHVRTFTASEKAEAMTERRAIPGYDRDAPSRRRWPASGFYNVDNNINNRKDNKRNNTIIIRWLDEKDTAAFVHVTSHIFKPHFEMQRQLSRGVIGRGHYDYVKKMSWTKANKLYSVSHVYLLEIHFVNSIYPSFSLTFSSVFHYIRRHSELHPFARALSLFRFFCLSFRIIYILTVYYRHARLHV